MPPIDDAHSASVGYYLHKFFFFRIMTIPERSPGQGLPEVDVLPVVSLVASCGHPPPASPSPSAPPRSLGIPEVALVLEPKAAEPGGSVLCVVRTKSTF